MQKLTNAKIDVIQDAINKSFDDKVAKYFDDAINNKEISSFLKVVATDWARNLYQDGWNNCKALLVKTN